MPLLLILDRITKIFFVEPGCFFLFCIKPSTNMGASFGLLNGWLVLLILIAIAVLVVIIFIYFFSKAKLNKAMLIALIFLFSGTLGNLIDRIFYGYVLDWLTFNFTFPAFNLADIFNTTGVIILVIELIKPDIKQKTENKTKNKTKKDRT